MESFSTLTEFAIAIAGFSGIAIAIRARGGTFDSLDQFRHKNLISFSLSAAFGSTFPQMVSHLGAHDSSVWIWSSLLFVGNCAFMLALPFWSLVALSNDERRQLSPLMWTLSVGGTSLTAILLCVNALGYLGEPSPAPLYVGILWQILMAAIQFSRMLFVESHSSTA